jgi:hypothetical protein
MSCPKENSRVPEPAMLITIQVGFSSPASRHPEFPDAGFVDGLDIVPD